MGQSPKCEYKYIIKSITYILLILLYIFYLFDFKGFLRKMDKASGLVLGDDGFAVIKAQDALFSAATGAACSTMLPVVALCGAWGSQPTSASMTKKAIT